MGKGQCTGGNTLKKCKLCVKQLTDKAAKAKAKKCSGKMFDSLTGLSRRSCPPCKSGQMNDAGPTFAVVGKVSVKGTARKAKFLSQVGRKSIVIPVYRVISYL